MTEAEYAQHRQVVFGGEPVEAPSEARSTADRLQTVSDEKLAAMEARLRDERERRDLAAFAAAAVAGDAEEDDLSDLTAADDVPYGDAFDAYAETPDMSAYYNEVEGDAA